MLETCADAFTSDELVASCRLFVNAIREEDAAAVDCVKFTGELIFKPGYGRMGSKPVLDGAPFTVDVVWLTWKQTGDPRVVAESIDPLVRAMAAMPVNPATGLAHISSSPGEDRCPYGFTDTVAKRGDLLFDSLLVIQAARRLSEMLTALGRTDDARHWEEAAARAAEGVDRVLWDRACPPDTYQNGGYWATPTGWFVHALALVDADKARQTVVDLVGDFARRGICEWVHGETTRLPGYVASATLPLQGIRALRELGLRECVIA